MKCHRWDRLQRTEIDFIVQKAEIKLSAELHPSKAPGKTPTHLLPVLASLASPGSRAAALSPSSHALPRVCLWPLSLSIMTPVVGRGPI